MYSYLVAYFFHIIIGKLHLKSPPPFPIYVSVRIVSRIIAELISQVNISHVVSVEFDDVEPGKMTYRMFFINYCTPACDFHPTWFLCIH